MWKLLKFIGAMVKAIFWLALILALSGTIALYILEQGVPAPLVRRVSEAISSDDMICRIGRATFSLKSGLHLHQVKAFQKRVADTALLSADEIVIDVSLQPRQPLGERIRGVTITNLSMPSLPPKHANAEPAEVKPEATQTAQLPNYCSTQIAVSASSRLPSVAPFPLILNNANILGVKVERLSATLSMEDPQLRVADVLIQWPDKTFAMSVSGSTTLDLTTRLVSGCAKGQTFPDNILPLLVSLHSRGAVKQINCFSKLERPVEAEASFTVNIDNSDFSLYLTLDVGPCAYREVPMKYAKGTLAAYGTNIYTTVVVGPIQAESNTGPLSGTLVYREESESLEVDARSCMDVHQMAKIIDILQHGELTPIRCDTPPTVTIHGIAALDRKKSTVAHDLTGHIEMPSGAIFKMPVKDVTSDLAVKGDSALFEHVFGTSESGGKISGNIGFFFPGGAAKSTLFSTRATFANVDLSDLSQTFNFSTNARAGIISGNLSLVGRAGNQTVATLAGEGQIRVSNGLLNRTPLFAGFTDYLARTIPGVSALVNQSSGSMDFNVEDGLLRTENLLIEGDLFSMKGRGTCDLPTEALDFVVRANIFKERTFAGRITHLVTLPFTRLLLEFKVFGTLDKTNWSYVNIIEKITGGITDLSDQFKSSSDAPSHPSTPAP